MLMTKQTYECYKCQDTKYIPGALGFSWACDACTGEYKAEQFTFASKSSNRLYAIIGLVDSLNEHEIFTFDVDIKKKKPEINLTLYSVNDSETIKKVDKVHQTHNKSFMYSKELWLNDKCLFTRNYSKARNIGHIWSLGGYYCSLKDGTSWYLFNKQDCPGILNSKEILDYLNEPE